MVSEQLIVRYKARLDNFVLDIDLSAAAGILALLGPSGCGKTTTLNFIAGLLKPTEGLCSLGKSIYFDSNNNIDLPPQKRSLGYVFQKALLFPHLTVAQNIQIGIHKKPRADQENRLQHLLQLLHLEELKNRKPSQLSGGQEQRVALARALAPEPRLLLLDEPFSAQLGDEVKRIHELLNVPVVMVTHLASEAERLASTIVYIENGTIKA